MEMTMFRKKLCAVLGTAALGLFLGALSPRVPQAVGNEAARTAFCRQPCTQTLADGSRCVGVCNLREGHDDFYHFCPAGHYF
jgi:hypothetical protein